ncbi:MAG: NUDIX hydrolase [Raineya sp.]|nr:NUDIX hydrolase [Raineya sp.]MDW8297231.1 NUDIX hydrolase [Raineya sp.]
MKKSLEDNLPKPTQNPWQILHSRDIYENPWIKVREDKVINPSGKEGIYGTVSFKNKAIGIVPIDEEGFTWLVGQYRYPLNEYSWEIPMGGGKVVFPSSKSFDEQILEAAQRELWEETGILAKKWTKIARIHTSNSVTDEEGFVFIAEDLIFENNAPEETEQLSIKKVHLSIALQWVLNDEITDAISMIGIMKACKLRGIM